MRFNLLKCANILAISLALAFAFIRIKSNEAESPFLNHKSSEFSENDIKNLHEFLKNKLNANILEFNLSKMTKPGDNYNSRLWGLQVKLVKWDHSSEVIIIITLT